jgi:hypothetical protein
VINSSGFSFWQAVFIIARTLKPQQEAWTGPAFETPINLAGVAEISNTQMYDAHNVNPKPGGDNPWFLETFPGNELSLNRSSGCCAFL